MPAPVADFTHTPDGHASPASVVFTDTSTNTPTSWAWDFGDHYGETRDAITTQDPTHIFLDPGTYTVTLTATNASGSSTASHSVKVTRDGRFHMRGIMNALASVLEANEGILDLVRNVFAFPFEGPPVPCLIVAFPDPVDFLFVQGGKTQKAEFPIWFIVDKVGSAQARDLIDAAFSQIDDFQTVIEADGTLGGAISDLELKDAKIEGVQIGGIDYQAIVFAVEVIS